MDGYNLAAVLRGWFLTQELRLVASQNRDFEYSETAGFGTHLFKPVSLEALDAAIAGCHSTGDAALTTRSARPS